jgi:hypothetical protein
MLRAPSSVCASSSRSSAVRETSSGSPPSVVEGAWSLTVPPSRPARRACLARAVAVASTGTKARARSSSGEGNLPLAGWDERSRSRGRAAEVRRCDGGFRGPPSRRGKAGSGTARWTVRVGGRQHRPPEHRPRTGALQSPPPSCRASRQHPTLCASPVGGPSRVPSTRAAENASHSRSSEPRGDAVGRPFDGFSERARFRSKSAHFEKRQREVLRFRTFWERTPDESHSHVRKVSQIEHFERHLNLFRFQNATLCTASAAWQRRRIARREPHIIVDRSSSTNGR